MIPVDLRSNRAPRTLGSETDGAGKHSEQIQEEARGTGKTRLGKSRNHSGVALNLSPVFEMSHDRSSFRPDSNCEGPTDCSLHLPTGS